METVKIGLIGCGGIADSHIIGYGLLHGYGIRNFSIPAVCDLVEEKASEASKKIGLFQGARPTVYKDFEVMLRETDLDAVDICTDHRSHHLIANTCLKGDKHVMVEKPLGITMRAAKTIVETAKKMGKILAVAENYRRTPENRATKWCIDQGMIGDPRMIYLGVAGWSMGHQGWREDKLISGGSWFFDGMVHYADLHRYFLNKEAKTVYAMAKIFEPIKGSKKVSVDDAAMALIEFEDGIIDEWWWSRVAHGENLNWQIVCGSKASVDVFNRFLIRKVEDSPPDWQKTNLRTLERKMLEQVPPERRERMFPAGVRDSVASEENDFILSILNNEKPEVDGTEAYKDMAIPLAGYESSVLGKPVRVKDIEALRIEGYQGEINENLNL